VSLPLVQRGYGFLNGSVANDLNGTCRTAKT
jgi:hypothetical protein